MQESLELKELKAIMRAEFRQKQTLERLAWEEYTLKPAVQKFKAMAIPGEEQVVTLDWGKNVPKKKNV